MMGEIMRFCIDDVSWILHNGRDWACRNGEAGVCEETVKDGCDSLLMPVCGSVRGRGTSGSGMGYHGNVLLKTNVGGGEPQTELYSRPFCGIYLMTVNRSMVVKTSSSHRWGPGLNPRSIQICSVLMQWNWCVETMGGEITSLCDGDVSWLLQNWRGWGCGSSGTGLCWQIVQDGWWISSTACVEICWRWVHRQRGVGC